jgi:hypothetical protein
MHHFAAETLHHEQRNGCTISNGHDAPRPAVSMHHPSRRIHIVLLLLNLQAYCTAMYAPNLEHKKEQTVLSQSALLVGI